MMPTSSVLASLGRSLARLRKRNGVAFAGIEIGSHQIQDCGGFVIEPQRLGLKLGFWRRRCGGCGRARVFLAVSPNEDAKAQEAEDHQGSQPGFHRYETEEEQLTTHAPYRLPQPTKPPLLAAAEPWLHRRGYPL